MASWDDELRAWRMPFRSFEKLRRRWPNIEKAARHADPEERKRRREAARDTEAYKSSKMRNAERRRQTVLAIGEVLKRFCEESHDQLHARRATSPSLPLRPQEPHPQGFTDESGARRGHDNGKASNSP